MIPTSIDGTDITGATIDGTDVQEITVDGQTVFKDAFSHFDDFDANTLADYDVYLSGIIDDSQWTISNSELHQADDNDQHYVGYPVNLDTSTNFFAESVVSSYGDDDLIGLGFEVGSTLIGANIRKQVNEAYYGEEQITGTDYSFASTGNIAQSNISVSYATPFTQRLELTNNNVSLKHNGSTIVTGNLQTNGSIDTIGLISMVNQPGVHFDSFEIGEF